MQTTDIQSFQIKLFYVENSKDYRYMANTGDPDETAHIDFSAISSGPTLSANSAIVVFGSSMVKHM